MNFPEHRDYPLTGLRELVPKNQVDRDNSGQQHDENGRQGYAPDATVQCRFFLTLGVSDVL